MKTVIEHVQQLALMNHRILVELYEGEALAAPRHVEELFRQSKQLAGLVDRDLAITQSPGDSNDE